MHSILKTLISLCILQSVYCEDSLLARCDISDHPAIVSIHLMVNNKTNLSYTGVLLTPSWVISTVSLGVFANSKDHEISSEDWKLSSGKTYYQPKTEDLDLNSMQSWTQYKGKRDHHPLALYSFDPLNMSTANARVARLPPRKSFSQECKAAKVVGWGDINVTTDQEELLTCTSVEVLKTCTVPHHENELCIKRKDGGQFNTFFNRMFVMCDETVLGMVTCQENDVKIARVVDLALYMTWIQKTTNLHVPFQSSPPKIFEGLTMPVTIPTVNPAYTDVTDTTGSSTRTITSVDSEKELRELEDEMRTITIYAVLRTVTVKGNAELPTKRPFCLVLALFLPLIFSTFTL